MRSLTIVAMSVPMCSYKISFIGSGYSSEKALESHPQRRDVVVKGSVTGPDPGYNATSGILATLGYVNSSLLVFVASCLLLAVVIR